MKTTTGQTRPKKPIKSYDGVEIDVGSVVYFVSHRGYIWSGTKHSPRLDMEAIKKATKLTVVQVKLSHPRFAILQGGNGLEHKFDPDDFDRRVLVFSSLKAAKALFLEQQVSVQVERVDAAKRHEDRAKERVRSARRDLAEYVQIVKDTPWMAEAADAKSSLTTAMKLLKSHKSSS